MWHWRSWIKAWLQLRTFLYGCVWCSTSAEPDLSVRALCCGYGLVPVFLCIFGCGFVFCSAKAQDIQDARAPGTPPPASTTCDRQLAESAEPTSPSCAFQRTAEEVRSDVLSDDGFPPGDHRQPAHTRQRGPAEEGKDICRKTQNCGYISTLVSPSSSLQH